MNEVSGWSGSHLHMAQMLLIRLNLLHCTFGDSGEKCKALAVDLRMRVLSNLDMALWT